VGVDGFRRCSGPEQLRDLGVAFLFRLLRESKVFPVRLGLPGERVLQVLFRL
jgi:hypothetical protein